MKNLVSIIVPVYNVEQYLDRCVASLAGQTYENIEIILVDDGSKDTSGVLCDRWAARDHRIKAFHKENGGLSDARNYGLERATGDYVCFIDSDDWCDLRFVEVMLSALLETDSDIAECDYLETDGSRVPPNDGEKAADRRVFQGKECFLHFLTNTFFVSVWNKLYRREMLEGHRFIQGVYHEDESWTYKIFGKARRACRLHYTGYYYYQRPGSIVHTKPSLKRLTDAFDAGKERIAFVELHFPEYAPVAYSKMMYTCMYLYNDAGEGDSSWKDGLRAELLAYFRLLFGKYLKARQYQKEMWRFCFFRLFPDRYCQQNY